MKTQHTRRLVGALLLSALIAAPLITAPLHAEDDIAWKHRTTQGAATLTANPLGAAARTAF
jgi:hypothetical protein